MLPPGNGNRQRAEIGVLAAHQDGRRTRHHVDLQHRHLHAADQRQDGGLLIQAAAREAERRIQAGELTVVRLSFADQHGILRGKTLVAGEPAAAMKNGVGFTTTMLLKDTSLITVIGGKEMVYAAQAIYGRTYEQMFPLIGIACIYLVLVMVFSWLQSLLERRLRQSDRR